MKTVIDKFLEITKGSSSPEIFRKWIAVSMVASSMGRRVHTTISEPDGPFFPNLYVLLVAEPGVGKTIPLKRARAIMKQVPNVDTGPDQITPQKLIRRLAEKCELPENADEYNVPEQEAVMALFIDEFGSLVRRDDYDLMTLLAGLYNSPAEYEYDTKTAGHDVLVNAQLNLLAGTQPDTFAGMFTAAALGQGFPARLMLIYSDERRKQPLFASYGKAEKLTRDLVGRLERITHMEGEFRWSRNAREYYVAEYEADFPPVPTDPALAHYNTRRSFHAAKLAMVMSAAESTEQMIRKRHVERAKALMVEAEQNMSRALIGVGDNRHRIHEERAVQYVQRYEQDRKRPVPEAKLRRFLANSMESYMIGSTIDGLINSRRLKAGGKEPTRNFRVGDDP